MKHESEFNQDKQLDIHNLHEEWQKQSGLYGKWAARSAKATKDQFLLKEKLTALKAEVRRDVDEVRAVLDLEVRQNWAEYEEFDKKPTEAAIMNWIILQDKFKEVNNETAKKIKKAVDELADAIENEKYLDGAVMAMTHRKNSIEGEVQLWLGGYFSDPKIPKTLKEEVQKETQTKVRRGLKRKRKGE